MSESTTETIIITPDNYPSEYDYGVRKMEIKKVKTSIALATYVCRYDKDGNFHGERVTSYEYYSIGETRTEIYKYVFGKQHNQFGAAVEFINTPGRSKEYYLNNWQVKREELEKEQRAAIIELLPQPIWEEVLEHYAIDA